MAETFKKATELTTAGRPADSNVYLIHDGSALKKITHDGLFNGLIPDGAGPHNAVYRGKNLGSSLTDAQSAEISSGRFRDLCIGDYWNIGGKVYRIAGFDYFLNCGDTNLATHHAVIVPDANLATGPMNQENTTQGGYTDCYCRTEGALVTATGIVDSAFGEHVLSYRDYMVNGVNSSGMPNAGVWTDAKVELMTEEMVYGTAVYAPRNGGVGTVPSNVRCGMSQLPLFMFNPTMIKRRSGYWLRDTVSSTAFAHVSYGGNAYSTNASNTGNGVRPCFLIS